MRKRRKRLDKEELNVAECQHAYLQQILMALEYIGQEIVSVPNPKQKLEDCTLSMRL